MRQGAAVYIFKLAAQRDAVGGAARADVVLAGQLGKIMRGGFAFHSRVGGDDEFVNDAFSQTCGEKVKADFVRADAIERA